MKDEGKTKKELIQELQDLRTQLAESKYSEDGCKEAEKALRVIVEGVTAATGDAFFHALVEHLAKTLNTKYALVGELSPKAPDTINTIAVFADGKIVDNFEYSLENTPCQNVIGQILRCYPHDIQQQFPEDHLLVELGVDSYAGTPLFDSSRRAIGLMVVMDSKPLENVGIVESLLQIFAIRASAELERKQVEEELRKNEAKLRKIIETSQEGIVILDTAATISFVNKRFSEMLDYEENELIGSNPLDFLDEADRLKAKQSFEHRKQGKKDVLDLRFLRKDGTSVWGILSTNPLFDADGKFTGSFSMITDITERKKAEENLVHTRERLEFLLQNSPAVIYTCEYGGNWSAKYMSTNLKEVLGYEARENLEDPTFWSDRVHPDDKPRIFEDLKKLENNDHHIHEYRFLHKDGTYRWMRDELKVIRDVGGRPVECIGYWIDITKRRLVEEALHESKERYQRIVEDLPDLICRYTPDTTITFVNEAYAKYFNKSTKGLVGTSFLELIPTDSHTYVRESINSLSMDAPETTMEHEVILPDGQARWHRWRDHALFDSHGHITEIQSIGQDITERKKAEEALRQSEKRFRSIFNTAAVGVAIVDANGTVLDANDADCTFLGYPRDELIGMHFTEFTHPDDLEIDTDLYGSLVAGKRNNYMIEKRYVRKDKEIVWGRLNVSLIRDHLGQIQYTVVVCEDITERKKAEEALREERDRAQQYLDVAGVMLAAIDANQIVSLINKQGADILGYREEEIVGKNWFDMVIPERMKEVVRKVFEQLMAGEVKPAEYFENPIVTKDGEERIIAWHNTILRDGSGAITGTLSSGEDITERKKANEALRLNETRLRALLALNRMTDASLQEIASFVLEQGLQLTTSTVGFVGLMSDDEKVYSAYALSRSTLKDCDIIEQPLHFDVSEAGIWADAVRKRKPLIINDYATPDPGKKGFPEGHVPLTRLLSIPFMEGDRVVGIAAVANKESDYGELDIQQLTLLMGGMWRHIQRMKIEEERQKSQKLESIGLLAGGLAHDFNNLLTGILGNIELAKMYADPNDKVYEKLENAGQIFLRAKDLTQQLLTFSRGGEPLKKIIPLTGLVKDSATFAVRGSNARCEFSIAEEICSAEVDEGQISQVVNNLAMNAAQAMPSGGTVDILCDTITITSGDTPSLKPGTYLKISIRDHGIGIPKEHLIKIFDPYFTTKQKGSGLGLATSYSIIKRHGGHIAVESELGVGTTFHVYLPASDQTAPERIAEDSPLLGGTGRILLMDDEEAVRQVGREMLKYLGYEVTFAEDGDKAIQLYKAAQESGSPYDVIIMDLTIPGGMGGKEAIQVLREMDPDVKVIVSSGYSDDPVMAEYKKYGFSGVVAKPYKVKELSKTVYDVMKTSHL